MSRVKVISLPEQEPEDWQPDRQPLLEYLLAHEAAIRSGAMLTRAGLDALAGVSVAGVLSEDLAAGVRSLACLQGLLGVTSSDTTQGDLCNDVFSLHVRWGEEARRFFGVEGVHVLLEDFPGCSDLFPLFRQCRLRITMLRELPPGIDQRAYAFLTEGIIVRSLHDARMLLSG